MFVGAIPKPCVEQALRIVPPTDEVFVCCSGSFRLEQAIHERLPSTRIYSNDVSLLSVTRERRISKLISMLATSAESVGLVERSQLTRFKEVVTTVFTDKPVSMKYRGFYKLKKRGQGFLQYAAPPSRKDARELYAQWFKTAPRDPDPSQETT